MWRIVFAEKITRRNARAKRRGAELFQLKQSVWRVALVGDDGRRMSVLATAESNRSESKVKTRAERYVSGSSGVIKKLTPFSKQKKGVVIPSLVLKSFNDSASAVVEDIQLAARYMQAQGYMAYGGFRSKRQEISYKSLGVVDLGRPIAFQAPMVQATTVPFVVMQFIGDGRDMQVAFTSADNPPRLDTLLRRDKFTKAICRLLAFIDFFHTNQKRIILDIKPDNIMPIFDAEGDIIDFCLIDLDGSIAFHSVTVTPKYISQSDFPAIKGARMTSDVSGLSVGIDYRALANALVLAIVQVNSEGFLVKNRVITNPYLGGYKHFLIDFKVSEATFASGRLPPLHRLLNALKHYDAAVDNTAMLKTLFETDYPEYMQTYEQACIGVRRRYNSDVAPIKAGADLAGERVGRPSHGVQLGAKKMKRDTPKVHCASSLLVKQGAMAVRKVKKKSALVTGPKLVERSGVTP